MSVQSLFCVSLLSLALTGCDEAVKVSSFGYDPEDSTRFIQAALDSGVKKLVLDKQAGPWYTLPLKMRSNTELVLEPGVELVAKRGAYKDLRDYLLELPYATNVVIRGGEGSALRMWKTDYQGPDYRHGEWRYALRIFHCENVLVEGLRLCDSGGDGIGVTGRNITIRKCVCDNNHRQGISVFSVDGLLIEDCVLSNTKGTAPEAGIDFEPDCSHEGLANVVMRNCLSINNSGKGYDFFLGNLNAASPRTSITIENCRSVGNSRSVQVNGSFKDGDYVTGDVTFRNCSFEDARGSAIVVNGVPDKAFDVAFENCVVSNAAPKGSSPDVVFSAGKFSQGAPDGIRLDNLTIYQPTARKWFSYSSQGCGGHSSRVGGDVTVVAPDGRRTRETLDAAWIRANMPAVNGGRPLPPRAALPRAADVVVADARPGELVPLAPCTLINGAKILFFAEKAGKVRFVGRQVIAVKGRKPETKKMTVTALGADGKPGKRWQLPRPSDVSVAFAFDAPKAGFYTLSVPAGGTRFQLEKSSVPVALDLSEGENVVAALADKPFSLHFAPSPNREFAVLCGGGSYYRFAADVRDAAGKVVASRAAVKSFFTHTATADAAGLWSVGFARCPEPHYDWITVDLYGAAPYFFLSAEKTWRVR